MHAGSETGTESELIYELCIHVVVLCSSIISATQIAPNLLYCTFTDLELCAILLHQEVQLEVMEVIQEGFAMIVHKEQRLVGKLLQYVLNLLWLQIPEYSQDLEGKKKKRTT